MCPVRHVKKWVFAMNMCPAWWVYRHFALFMSDMAVGGCCCLFAEWLAVLAFGDKCADVFGNFALHARVC